MGGVVGEDGINSVLIGEDGVGKIYSNFQKEIKKLSTRCSLSFGKQK